MINDKDTSMTIIKGYGATATGREYVLWHVVAEDGYIIDSFSRKYDAKIWIERNKNESFK
jgi:hypothetical protein